MKHKCIEKYGGDRGDNVKTYGGREHSI